MNILDRIMAGLTMVAMLAACSEAELNTEASDIADGEMPVNLRICIPLADDPATTRSSVSGAEEPFMKIQMVCFASTGYLLGVREATASAWDANYEGTIKGSVPASTTRIHFIANKNDIDANSMLGQQEMVVMHAKETPFVVGTSDPISYWGYHKADNNNEMATWLKGDNTVYLLRDRAQVTVKNKESKVTEMQWTIVNGLETGYIAPYDRNTTGGFIETGNVPAPNHAITAYAGTRFTDTDNWTALDASQYIFEDRNETGTGRQPLILLLKAKFTGSTDEKFFKVQMEDHNHQQIRFTRNHHYTLTIKELDEKLGRMTAQEAIDGAFINGALKAVDEDVTSVSYGGYKLSVNETYGTKVLFQSGTTGIIHFSFLKEDGTVDGSVTADDFIATWQEDDDPLAETVYSSSNIAIAYDPTTGEGTLTVSLAAINSALKKNRLELSHKGGLIRYVTVYTAAAFNLGSPVLTESDTHGSRKGYQLELQMPKSYPADLYPITIRLASSTLSPYSDNSGSEYGMFSTTVTSTADLPSSTNDRDWNYKANNWNFWYEYSLSSYPTDGKVTFLLEDVCSSRATQATNVGLYLYIPYFDGIKAVTP